MYRDYKHTENSHLMFYAKANDALTHLIDVSPPRRVRGHPYFGLMGLLSGPVVVDIVQRLTGELETTVQNLIPPLLFGGGAAFAYSRAMHYLRADYEPGYPLFVNGGFTRKLTRSELDSAIRLQPTDEDPNLLDGDGIFLNGIRMPTMYKQILLLPAGPFTVAQLAYIGTTSFAGAPMRLVDEALPSDPPEMQPACTDAWLICRNVGKGVFAINAFGNAVNHHIAKHGGARTQMWMPSQFRT